MGSYEGEPRVEIGGSIPLSPYQQHENGQLSFLDPEALAENRILDPNMVELQLEKLAD